MDVVFEVFEENYFEERLKRFNPSSNGCGFRGRRLVVRKVAYCCFNPSSNGCGFRGKKLIRALGLICCFNPSSNGCGFRGGKC